MQNVDLKWSLACHVLSTELHTTSYDISNYEHVKRLPILVSYLQVYNLETPVKNGLLSFVENSGETADISTHVMKATANYYLDTKVI